MNFVRTRRPIAAAALLAAVFTIAIPSIAAAAPTPDLEVVAAFDIHPQQLTSALVEFSRQANTPVVSATRDVDRFRTPGISGKMSLREALRALLAGTNLDCRLTESGAIAVGMFTAAASANTSAIPLTIAQASTAAGSETRKTSVEGPEQQTRSENALQGVPEILVQGSRLLNLDIPRSRDDIQPYVIFERRTLEQSGAANLNDFFKQRLTMNTTALLNSQITSTVGNTSGVNLRGLGANQTLILIDGHRLGNPVASGEVQQADVNGIPMSAIERIEILPSTASGIYGGTATGGVINIVLRRDYTGAEFKVDYEDSFSNDAPLRRVEFSTGFNLEDGKTNVLLSGSYSDQDALRVRDRDYYSRGIARILENNPAALLNAPNPPLGSTANIVSSTGAPLTLANNGQALNATRTFVPIGYAGPASDNGAGLRANAGQYNFALADAGHFSGGGLGGLMIEPTVTTVSATVRRQFGSHVQGFLDVSAYDNRGEFLAGSPTPTFSLAAGAAGNPFNQAIRVTVPLAGADTVQETKSSDRRAVAGAIVQLPRKWRAEADYSWNRSKRQDSLDIFGIDTFAAGAAVSSGALNVFRDPALSPFNISSYLQGNIGNYSGAPATFRNLTGRLAGPLWHLPAGDIALSTLIETRDEDFAESYLRFPLGLSTSLDFYYPNVSQKICSAYLEARIPLFSTTFDLPGIRSLEVQLAGRFDEYDIEGANMGILVGTPATRFNQKLHSTNPTVGLRYEPLEGVALRASYGTGFLPPSVVQLAPTPSSNSVTVNDPRRGGTSVTFNSSQSGGNPNLRPEDSDSRSLGLVLNPGVLRGVRISVDYTLIKKTDNITTLVTQSYVDNEFLIPGRVVRGPVPANDPYGVGPIVFLDRSLVNVARARSEAYDFAVDWTHFAGRLGTWTVQALATRQMHYQTQLQPRQPIVENVGVLGPATLKWKGNLNLTWDIGPWSAGWNARYYDSYLASTNATTLLNQGNNGVVPSQHYHDLFVSRRWDDTATPWLRQFQAQFGVKNVFNTRALFDAGQLARYYSAFGDPRDAVYYLNLKKAL